MGRIYLKNTFPSLQESIGVCAKLYEVARVCTNLCKLHEDPGFLSHPTAEVLIKMKK